MADDDPMLDDEAALETEQGPVNAEQALAALIASTNLAEDMPEAELAEIAAKVCREYEIDETSRKPWLDKNADAMKLATMVAESKDYPFKGASNVKYPMIATAALQFNARSYPAIVPADRVVKCKVRGRDPEGVKAARADRVSEYMSDQLLSEMPEWEEDTDRLLIVLPVEGSCFRKVWFDPALGRNVSRLVRAENFVVNNSASSIESAPRKTEKLWLYPYEIKERILDGRFSEFDFENTDPGASKDGKSPEPDSDAAHLFLEQHRLLDLDRDGYAEPYIVTVHQSTQDVVRVVANYGPDTITFDATRSRVLAIRPESYFVHYQFQPNPDGGFYAMGLGWLLGSTNETVNTTLNQMMDAGHLANTQGGMISSVLGLREKTIRLERGEWRVVNTSMPLNQAVLPITYPGPPEVLFKLLGLLIEAGKEMSATKDVMTGEGPQSAPATTTLALIEQGLQVFNAIYKRVHRGLKGELAILARLNFRNAETLDPKYVAFFDAPPEQQVSIATDFDMSDMDILPVSDPQSVTKMQKIAKAQLVLESSKGNPMVNQAEALKRFYEAADVEDIDKLIVPPPEPDPAEVAFMEAVKQFGLQEQMAKITEIYTKSIKNVADAEAAEEGQQLSLYDMFVRTLQAEHSMEMEQNGGQAGPGGIPGMEGQPNDPAGAQPLSGPGAPGTGVDPAALAPGGDAGLGGMGQPAGTGSLPQGAL